jgi:anti-anti-sigma factor
MQNNAKFQLIGSRGNLVEVSKRPSVREFFEIEQQNDTIVVVLAENLGALEYERFEEEGRAIFDCLNGADVKNVVLDFQKTNYVGSTAIGFFLRIWKQVGIQNGSMALCNVSGREKDSFHVTKLDQLWPICSSRKDAMDVVKERSLQNAAPSPMERT